MLFRKFGELVLFTVITEGLDVFEHVAVAGDIAREESGDIRANVCLLSIQFKEGGDLRDMLSLAKLRCEFVDTAVDVEEGLIELLDGHDVSKYSNGEMTVPTHERLFFGSTADVGVYVFGPIVTSAQHVGGGGCVGKFVSVENTVLFCVEAVPRFGLKEELLEV